MNKSKSPQPGAVVLTIQDFCAMYRVGRTHVYHEIAEGRLPARKTGKRTLILRSDAEAWLFNLPAAPTKP